MGTGIDFEKLLWDVSESSPLLLTYLVGAGMLIAKRRAAPQVYTIAAWVCLALFFEFLVTTVASEWISLQIENSSFLTVADYLLLSEVFSWSVSCFEAVCFGVLAWCVLMRRPMPTNR